MPFSQSGCLGIYWLFSGFETSTSSIGIGEGITAAMPGMNCVSTERSGSKKFAHETTGGQSHSWAKVGLESMQAVTNAFERPLRNGL